MRSALRPEPATPGGTGLGLAFVRHLAVNHRGEVAVQSLEGDGSTFTLRLCASAPVNSTCGVRPNESSSNG